MSAKNARKPLRKFVVKISTLHRPIKQTKPPPPADLLIPRGPGVLRQVRRGEIGPDDEVNLSIERIIEEVIEWADLRQLKVLRAVAEGLDMEKCRLH